jgi:hypothetical protein
MVGLIGTTERRVVGMEETGYGRRGREKLGAVTGQLLREINRERVRPEA